MLQIVKTKNGSAAKSTKKTRKPAPKRVENEIERHVRKIRSLIEKLPPRDRQDYFSGLLNHILSDSKDATKSKKVKNYNSLSRNEVILLSELSTKMEELYRTMDYNPYL